MARSLYNHVSYSLKGKKLYLVVAVIFIIFNALSTLVLQRQKQPLLLVDDQLLYDDEEEFDFGSGFDSEEIDGAVSDIGGAEDLKIQKMAVNEDTESIVVQNNVGIQDQMLSCTEMIAKFPITYARNYTSQPVTIQTGSYSTPQCSIPCVHTPQPFHDPDAQMNVDISQTMESSVYYPNTHPKAVHERGIRVAMTPRLDSDVPVGYFSYAEYQFMKPIDGAVLQKRLAALKQYAESLKRVSDGKHQSPGDLSPLAVAVISNCAANTFRLEAVNKLIQLGVPVSTYGRCFPQSPSLPSDWQSKMNVLEQTPFTLAFENSFEDDYVTEKYLQAIVAGSVPIVIGANNIMDFDPIDETLTLKIDPDIDEQDQQDYAQILGGGLIRIPSLDALPKVVKLIQYLAGNPDMYMQMIIFKQTGLGRKFAALVDMAVVHSECRLCIHLATQDSHKIITKSLNSEQLSQTANQCRQNGQVQRRILIRERGRFYYHNLLVPTDSDNISVDEFYSKVLKLFGSLGAQSTFYKGVDVIKTTSQSVSDLYTPIWDGHRPDFFKSARNLKIHRIYPVDITQREALYGDQVIDTDSKVRRLIEQKGIVRLEVIFV
ncbi:hypothetical protein MP228_012531 [Amoeboaphelidium protococcarum]|nr:hypothetical protein MP228_012531 [Amoeboaphelidium protococcarum]